VDQVNVPGRISRNLTNFVRLVLVMLVVGHG
jgi:hypothetical protein